MMGESQDYLTIKILHNDMTVMVPARTPTGAGLRRVIDEDAVRKVIGVLTGEVSEMPKNWNRRFKYNREKIKTGDVYELAEVVRNLAIREWEKGLSTGEKQMYTRAKKILASEFMYALDKDEEGAEEYIDGLLEERFGATSHRLRAATAAVALIAAAGSGERLGAGGPKALVEVGGRPLLAWSVDAFAAAPEIGLIVIAAPPGAEAEVERIAALRPAPTHVIVVTGGAARGRVGGPRRWPRRRPAPRSSPCTTRPGRS